MRVFILTRKRIAVLCAALVAIAGIGAIGAKRNDLAVAANSGGRNIPIYYVKTEEKKVKEEKIEEDKSKPQTKEIENKEKMKKSQKKIWKKKLK